VLLLLLIILSFITISYNAFTLQNQLDKTRVTASDSRVWNISRIEVDHQQLMLALVGLRDAQVSLPLAKETTAISTLSNAFDVFYSRVDVVQKVFVDMDDPDDLMSKVDALGTARDALAQQFDQLDMTDAARLLVFEKDVSSLTPSIREIVFGGLQIFVEETKQSRKIDNTLTLRFLATSIVALAMMAVTMLISFWMRREVVEQFKLLKAANDNAEMIYEESKRGVIVLQTNGNILLFNRAAEKIFGCEKNDVTGRNIDELEVPERLKRAPYMFGRGVGAAGKSPIVEQGPERMSAQRVDGTEFILEVSIKFLTDTYGEDIFIAFLQDVSEQAYFEESLRNARDQARRHAAEKTMFLATMSHEMRTPLHGLLAALDLVDTESVDATTRKLLKTARDCGMRSLLQMSEVLELTRIEEIDEKPVLFSPALLISQIFGELGALAKDNDNKLNMRVTGVSPDVMWLGMPRTFTRVMYNLIGNALKFTNDGWVYVILDFGSAADGGYNLSVCVEDTGIGITAEDQLQIFDMFFTSDDYEALEQNGKIGEKSTGLGLRIAQLGVKKMGGEIAIESEKGLGSRFFFEIPVQITTELATTLPQPSADAPRSKFDLKVLVVDDNVVNLQLTSQLITQMGCTAVTAENGGQAVFAAQKAQFHIVLMDLNMPGLNGWDAARQIRQGGASKHALIVALTADIMINSSDLSSDSGIDAILHKPALRGDFEKLFNGLHGDVDNSGCDAFVTPPDVHEGAVPVWEPANFAEFFNLVGMERARRVLELTLHDIEKAVAAVRLSDPETADIIHHAIGSTATIGLLEMSHHLCLAENMARSGEGTTTRDCLDDLESAAKRARHAAMGVLASISYASCI